MMMKRIMLSGAAAISILAGLSGCRSEAVKTPAYGICENIAVDYSGSHDKFTHGELDLMKEAHIGWVRTDFEWGKIQPKRGEWDFKVVDEAVQWAEENGVAVLPILNKSAPWASPAYRNMDEWLEFVRTTVSRYKGRLHCWEVWNEENLTSSQDKITDPIIYAYFLRRTCKEIKKADPDSKVLIGGLSCVPCDYLDAFYKAEGKDCFDIMNIHPYAPQRQSPETDGLYEKIQGLRALMEKYGDGGKPIWITEVGYPTNKVQNLPEQILKAGLKTVDPQRKDWNAAVLSDPDLPDYFELDDAFYRQLIGEGGSFRRIRAADIPSLASSGCKLLVMHPSESFPADYFGAMEDFVKKGGTVFLWGGVPLYYEMTRQDGAWRKKSSEGGKTTAKYRKSLGIGWEAFWTKPGVPGEAKDISPADGFKDSIKLDPSDKYLKAYSFLTGDSVLESGKFIPIIFASKDSYKGALAAVYLHPGKGAVIVSNIKGACPVSEETQAKYLPRTLLISFQAGVETAFWYCLRAWSANFSYYDEACYGIVRGDMSPKPAWLAYKALIRARPAGSAQTPGEWTSGDVCLVSWRRPDGDMAWAAWSKSEGQKAKVQMDGKIKECFGCLGNDMGSALEEEMARGELSLSSSPIYIIGPVKLSLVP